MNEKFAFGDGREPGKRTATCYTVAAFNEQDICEVCGEETGVQTATGRILEHKIC